MRMARRRALFALAALACTACSRGSHAPSAPRVVSLSPSTTEAVYAIGKGSTLVGRSRFCDYPPEAAALPVVGGFADPSVEAIVALAPSLVVGARGPAGPALEASLKSHKIETFFPETESFAQIEDMLTGLGERLHAVEGAKAAVRTIEDARARVRRATQGKPPVRVVLLFDVAPIVVAGPGGFPDELIREAGGENLIKEGGPYPTLNLERLLTLDPDLLLDGASEEHQGASRLTALRDAPGWQKLSAMREGKIRSLSLGAVLRPGPRIGEGLLSLARAIHGNGDLPL